MITNVKDLRPGVGLDFSKATDITDRDQDDFIKASLPHYVYMPGGAPPDGDLWVGDRALKVPVVYRGRIMRLTNFSYRERNQSEAALLKENPEDVPEDIRWVKTAKDQAEELTLSYNGRGLHVLNSITGVPVEQVAILEEVILPVVPASLIKTINELEGAANDRVAAMQDKVLRKLAEKLLPEMLAAAHEAWFYQTDYIDATESEQIERSKPGGVGKARLDKADRYYYAQLERQPAHASGVIVSQGPQIGAQSQKEVVTKATIDCPECDETIGANARKCRFCGFELRPMEVVRGDKKK